MICFFCVIWIMACIYLLFRLQTCFELKFWQYFDIHVLLFAFLFKQVERKNQHRHVLLLAYQSFGLVHGTLSTSPLYVYITTFSGRLHHYQTENVVYGVFSLIFWTLTILLFFKYVIIMLSADDNGEGEN